MSVFQTDLFNGLPEGRNAHALLSVADAYVVDEKIAESLNFVRDSVRQSPNEKSVLLHAASLFSALGQVALAADCYEQIYALGEAEPSDIVQHAALLGQLGQHTQSAEKYAEAMRLDPANLIHAPTGSNAFIQAGQPRRGALVMLAARRGKTATESNHWLYTISALKAAGRITIAMRLAETLRETQPYGIDNRYMLASLYADDHRLAEARTVLDHPDTRDHSPSCQLLAAIFNQLGNNKEALEHINRAIALDGKQFSILSIRASIYSGSQMFDAAANDYLAILGIQPGDHNARRGAFLTLTEAGRYSEAIPIGAGLAAQFPNDEDMRQTLQIVMERNSAQSTMSALDIGNISETLGRRFGVPPKVDRSHKLGANPHPLILQWRVIIALLLRETRTRFGKSRLGYLWVIFEPLAHIGIMITLIAVLGHSRTPPIGESFALFYFTGIIPFHMFTHTVGHLMHSVPENRPLLQLPRVKVLDVYIARGILELLTEICVAALLLMGFMFFGFNIVPLNPIGVISAFLLIWLCGFGVGLISAVLARFFSAWPRIWGAITSILYFASGTFYIPRMMPEGIRDILAWGPTLQAIEMVRVNYFIEPYPYWLDVSYLAGFALISLAIGLLLERLYRNRTLEAE